MANQRKHDKEFKTSICELIVNDKLPVATVSKEYGLSKTMVHRWVREYKTYGKDSFVGRGNQRPEEKRIKELEKENLELKMEIEILKKTKKYFLKQQNRK